jgi:hypothetical protein
MRLFRSIAGPRARLGIYSGNQFRLRRKYLPHRLCTTSISSAPPAKTTAPCGVSGGYISITSPSGLDSISGCTTIASDLIITPARGQLNAIELPSGLHRISGSPISDGQDAASTVSIVAPSLSSVGSTQSTGAQGLTDLVATSGLVIGNFPSLANISFPILEMIESNFVIENNLQLSNVDTPMVSSVGGNLDLTGNFNSVRLPDLMTINGGTNIQSMAADFHCPSNIHGFTKGSAFNCIGNVTHPVPGQGLQYATTSSHKSSAAKKESSKVH